MFLPEASRCTYRSVNKAAKVVSPIMHLNCLPLFDCSLTVRACCPYCSSHPLHAPTPPQWTTIDLGETHHRTQDASGGTRGSRTSLPHPSSAAAGEPHSCLPPSWMLLAAAKRCCLCSLHRRRARHQVTQRTAWGASQAPLSPMGTTPTQWTAWGARQAPLTLNPMGMAR